MEAFNCSAFRSFSGSIPNGEVRFFLSAQNNDVLATHEVLWVYFHLKSTISLIWLSVSMSSFLFCFVSVCFAFSCVSFLVYIPHMTEIIVFVLSRLSCFT